MGNFFDSSWKIGVTNGKILTFAEGGGKVFPSSYLRISRGWC